MRVLQTVSEIKQLPLDYSPFVDQRQATEPDHQSSRQQRLSVEQLMQLYYLNEQERPEQLNKIIIFDDVLTRGNHYKAMQKVLRNHYPMAQIIGLFVARSCYRED